jgi:peroxiredoxin
MSRDVQALEGGGRITPWLVGVGALVVLASSFLIWRLATGSERDRATPPPVVKVENFALLDHQGRYRELYRQRAASAVVLYVFGRGCPITRGALPDLRALVDSFGERGVTFWLIDANPQDDRDALAVEARDWQIELPILLDEAQLVRRSLALERTAEALVIDPTSWTIVYRGALDDRLDYEVQRDQASRQPVAEVLEALLAGQNAQNISDQIAPAPVRGCLILDAAESRLPDYSEDVAPILIDHCVACHRPEGVAPWAMSDHDMVRGWSPMMREVIRTRRMLPWHADPHVGTFANDLGLSSAQARTLVQWIEAGSPRGDGEDPLPARAKPPETSWSMGEPDLVLDLPAQTIPAAGLLPYRYVDLDIPVDASSGRPLWVSAVDLRPANRPVLHHALAHVIYPPDHPKNAEHWQNEMFAGYAPGLTSHPFPEGTGRTVPVGAKIRVELHYITTGREETDTPQLGIYLAQQAPRYELHTRGPAQTELDIPPGAVDHQVEARFTFAQSAMLYALLPHMHYRGSRVAFEAIYPDGRREILLSVPNYRFTWQRYYVLAEAKPMPQGTEIVVRGAFDNSPQNPWNPDPTARVHWGSQSSDEMFIGYLHYAYRPVES